MGKRKPETPRSKIKAALRMLFLRSRERAAALKAAGYCCERCGVKQSTAKGREVKVEVHHKDGVLNWDEIYLAVYDHMLCDPGKMEVLCKECHKKEHSG
ncbi:MAG: HNH endonuclease [Pseudodesulfovibrio sp.]|nr:HNH endonuclease [Pseudodesulfovibrio sp.]